MREVPKSIRFDELGPEIDALMADGGVDGNNYSAFVRHLVRLGIKAERERRRILAGGSQIDMCALRGETAEAQS